MRLPSSPSCATSSRTVVPGGSGRATPLTTTSTEVSGTSICRSGTVGAHGVAQEYELPRETRAIGADREMESQPHALARRERPVLHVRQELARLAAGDEMDQSAEDHLAVGIRGAVLQTSSARGTCATRPGHDTGSPTGYSK